MMRSGFRFTAAWGAALMLGLMIPQSFAQKEEPKPEDIAVVAGAEEYMAPMRDGVKLATNVFIPKGPKAGEGPWPVIITRTPYGKDGKQFAVLNGRYGPKGYVYVAQDCRGKFRSEGKYRPFEDDLLDGYDTVEWVAQQPWCNGKIGVTGPSAMGITANLAAASDPPHLTAAFVIVAPSSMLFESTFQGGVFKEADVGNWLRGQGAGDRADEMKARPIMDERWKETDLPFHMPKVRIPMYNVGGWYDMFDQGNVNNFVYLQNEGREGAKGNQKLLMGPFGHGDLKGDLQYPGSAGLIGVVGEEFRWFDLWLKGVDDGIGQEPAVKYYMMASAKKGEASTKNGWRTSAVWPPAEMKPTKFYLHQNRSLSTDMPKGDTKAEITYAFDPRNPVKSFGGQNLTIDRGPKDQREVGERSDYIRFMTPVLEQDLEIAGQVFAELWVSSDAPCTDFHAKLVDVYPDGYEALLLDAPIRARYRDGQNPEDVKFLKPGEPVKVKIDLWSTANIFEKGHRVAVHITSSNHPRFEVNPNTGEAPGQSTKEPKIALNTLHLHSEHPSAVILPVLSTAGQ